MQGSSNSMAVSGIRFGGQSEIINEEKVRKIGASRGDLDGVPIFKGCQIADGFGQPLHAHNEDVRGHRVPLPNPSGRVESISQPPIHQYLDRTGGDAGHDELGEIIWNTKEMEGISYKGPLDSTKNLF